MSEHAHHHQASNELPAPISNFRLAAIATAHCLLGCGLGEIVGMVVGMMMGLSTVKNVVLAVVLGFVFGMALGIRPLLRAGFSSGRALKQVFVAEGLGIAVMEAVDIAVLARVPGAMEAHFTQPIFWIGMAIALAAGYIAALPVNYAFIRAGIRHSH